MVSWLKPRRVIRRKKPVRKAIVKRGRKALRRVNPKKGGMFVIRKMNPIRTSNGPATTGAYTVAGAEITGLNLGTPIAITGATTLYDVPFAMDFKLSRVVAHTEFTNLFDQYRLAFAKLKIQAAFNTGTSATTPVPFIDYILDHDDAVPPSIDAFRQKMGVKTKYFASDTASCVMNLRPVPNLEVYATALGSGYATPRSSPWIDCANDDVSHFALKGVIRNLYLPNVANVSLITWDVSLGLAFRDVQ